MSMIVKGDGLIYSSASWYSCGSSATNSRASSYLSQLWFLFFLTADNGRNVDPRLVIDAE